LVFVCLGVVAVVIFFRLHTGFYVKQCFVKKQTKEFAVGVTAVPINNIIVVWKVSTG